MLRAVQQRRLSPVLLAQGRHSEPLQSRRDIRSRAVRVDASVDVEDLAFGVDIVSPAVRQFTLRRYDPIGLRDAFVGIAQDRIVERERESANSLLVLTVSQLAAK